MAERRRILKVKNKFQDRMIVEILLVMFILINGLIIISFFTMETITDVYNLKLMLASVLAVGESGAVVIVYFYTLKASHKIAGPVYIMERNLNKMADGDLRINLRLRDHDHFHDTSEVLNDCAARLRERIADIKRTAATLDEKLGEDAAAKDLLAALHAQLAEFKTDEDTGDEASGQSPSEPATQ